MEKMNVRFMVVLMVMSLVLGFSSAVDFRWRKTAGFFTRAVSSVVFPVHGNVYPLGYIYIFRPNISKLLLKVSHFRNSLNFVFRFSLVWNRYYNVTINIGQPPRPYYLDLDTGSDLTWLQCDAPCVRCLEVLIYSLIFF